MEANELMIGDWVLVNGTPMQIQAINDIDGEIMASDELYCLIEDRAHSEDKVEPISLTPEILEKNGFERRKLDGGADVFVLAYDYYDITIEEWSDSIWVVRYDCTEMSTPHEQAVCGYVHQLQNFFRLSAPDELADNFKV